MGSELAGLPLFAQPACTMRTRPQRFDGPHEPEDIPRLSTQLQLVRDLMLSGRWFTLTEIAAAANCTTQSASARCRDLRKSRFGGFTVERKRIGETAVYQYRIVRSEVAP